MRLLFEGVDFRVFDKPSGETVDVARRGGEHLVHRLDKHTSGVLVVARSSAAAAQLSALFRERKVEKTYELLSVQAPSAPTCHLAIGPDPRRPRRWTDRPDGKPAETGFDVQARVEGLVLSRARPLTGRTHQIRIHARAVGAPILGDLDYGGVAATRVRDQVLRVGRVMLHARRLAFEWAGERWIFEADWPSDFAEAAAFTSPKGGRSRS